jgi:hypothetical protein
MKIKTNPIRNVGPVLVRSIPLKNGKTGDRAGSSGKT